ncbi:MAG TPA: L,D-transpeptidase family protein [Steroidobacteraceae bacterium]
MVDRRSPLRAAAAPVCAALLSTTLAACSLLGAPWSMRHHAAQPAPPPPPPPPPSAIGSPPVATFKFEVDPQDEVIGNLEVTHTTKDNTLVDLARLFDVGYEEISRANPGVDMWLPGTGRKVVLPTAFVLPDVPRQGIVINIAAMRLYYFPPHKKGEPQLVYTHPIGIGRVGWRTPVGVTKVVRREKNPTWRPPPSILKEHHEEGDDLPVAVGPGPDNPLGDRAFYLAWNGYLIHGTNKPAGVGLRVSHGCIHLFPEDIDALFDKVRLGTPVRVVNEPYVFGWRDGVLYMQAFGSLEDDPRWQKIKQDDSASAQPGGANGGGAATAPSNRQGADAPGGAHAQAGKDTDRQMKRFLAKALGPRIEHELARRHLRVDAELVMQLARSPRGVPVPVSEPQDSDSTSGDAVEQVLGNALQVRNALPEGSNWDGKTDLPADQTSPDGKSPVDAKQAPDAEPADPATGAKQAAIPPA